MISPDSSFKFVHFLEREKNIKFKFTVLGFDVGEVVGELVGGVDGLVVGVLVGVVEGNGVLWHSPENRKNKLHT